MFQGFFSWLFPSLVCRAKICRYHFVNTLGTEHGRATFFQARQAQSTAANTLDSSSWASPGSATSTWKDNNIKAIGTLLDHLTLGSELPEKCNSSVQVSDSDCQQVHGLIQCWFSFFRISAIDKWNPSTFVWLFQWTLLMLSFGLL